MKNFTQVNKWSIITPLLFVAFGLFGVNENAWGIGYDWYAKVNVTQGKGEAYVEIYNNASKKVVATSEKAVNETYQQTTTWVLASTTGGWPICHAKPATGYSFSSWYCVENTKQESTSADFNYKNDGGYNEIKGNWTRTFNARFSANSYAVTLAKNDGSGATQAVTATYDSAMPSTLSAGGAIVTPTRTNYTFLGYFDAAEGGTKYYNADLRSAHNWDKDSATTLYAHWAANYEVAFDKNGGQGDDMANQSFYYGEALKALSTNTYTRSYTLSYDKVEDDATCSTGTSNTSSVYTFDGWATVFNGDKIYNDGATVQNLSSIAGATVTLYAHWSGGSVTLPSATLDGKVLEGWYSNSSFIAKSWVGEAGESYTPTDNVTLYAKWIDKHTPVFTGPSYAGDYYEMDVDDTYSGFTFNHVSDSVAVISDDKVISYNKATNTLTALKAGTATIKFTQAENDTLLAGTSATWSVRVSLVSNTLALNSSSDTKYVGQEVTNVRDLESQNSNATIQTSSSAPGIAHYDVANNKIVIDNAGDSSFVSKSVTITIWQAATAKYAASGDKTFTLTVNKYRPSFTGSNYNGLKVDDEQTADYTYENVSDDAPTNDDDDNFYYTIENVEFDSIELNKKYNSLDSLVRFDPATKKITALNAGECDIVFHQKETRSIYSGTSASYHITVGKWDNTLYANSSASYSVSTYVDRTLDSIVLTATNTDYANWPISVTQTRATNDTVSYGYNASTRKVGIRTHHDLITATWAIHQDENYKYKAGNNTFSVTVGAVAEATNCYVKTDLNTEHEFRNDSWELKWDDEDAAGYLSFEAKAEAAWTYGLNVFQLINGSWDTVEPKYFSYDQLHTSYHPYGFQLDKRAKGVKFERTGTLRRWIKNVYVKRATYLTAVEDTIRISKTAGNNPVYPSDVAGAGRLIVDHSLANGGALKIANNNSSKFTLASTTISDVDCKTRKDTIAISYTPTAEGRDTAALIIYNDVYRDTVLVTGVCVKRNQSGRWKENIRTLTKGTKIGKPFSSTQSGSYGVTYTSSDSAKVDISASGDTIIAKAEGSARIYAEVRGDENYYAIRDSIDITVTEDKVQYIVWDQDRALRRLKLGDDDFVMNAYATSDIEECETNGPDAESPRPISYHVPAEYKDSIITVSGNVLTIVGAGKAKVIATQTMEDEEGEIQADADGHKYITVTMEKEVVVRDPSAPCGKELLYNFNEETIVRSETICGEAGANFVGGKVNNKSTLQTVTSCTFTSIPAYVSYAYKNDGSGTGSLSIEQYIPGTGWRVAKTITSFTSTWTPDTVSLRRDATQARIVPTQTKNYIYFGSVKVHQAQYIELTESDVVKDTLVFSSYIGTPQEKEVNVRWSDSRGDIFLSLPEGAPFTLSSEDFAAECNGADTTDLSIEFNTIVGQTDSCYNLVLTDGVTTKTIVLKASATAEEVTFDSTGDWSDDDENWSKLPNENTVATISEGVDVTISTEVEVYSLVVEEGASVTVTPTGGLTVGAGGITNPSGEKITLQVDLDEESEHFRKTGYVRISPDYEGEMPEADIEMYSVAYFNTSTGDVSFQFVGAPIEQENYSAAEVFKNSYLFTWNERIGDWEYRTASTKLEPFVGYATTQRKNPDGLQVGYSGKLVDVRRTVVKELQYTEGSPMAGFNLLANSFAAPIDISRLRASDFTGGMEAIVYLYNTGTQAQKAAGVSADMVTDEEVDAPGQYIGIPVSNATIMASKFNYPIVIPSMQGFFVKTSGPGCTVTLDYDRLVWTADYDKHDNTPLRAPRRAAWRKSKVEEPEEEEIDINGTMRLTLYNSAGMDHLFMLESDSYDASYENGYDARKMMEGELNIYSIEGSDQLSIDATNSMDGTRLGIRTGKTDWYTIAFNRVETEETLYLKDNYTGQTVCRIDNGAEYSFYAEPNSIIENRFEIVSTSGYGVATGVDNENAEPKAVKYIKDDTMYILKNGVKYTNLGQRVQ